MTDSLKSKVYNAEHEIVFIANQGVESVDFYGSTLQLSPIRKFGDIDSVQRYVEKVYELGPVDAKYRSSRRGAPKVRPRRGDAHAHYSPLYHEIAVPEHRGSRHSWAMNEIVVLHEIAHSLEKRGESHGTEFCLCFLNLLEWCVGGEWRLLLTRALDQRGVPLS